VSKRRLGKGIDALLQGRDLTQLENLESEGASVNQIPLINLKANPNQPRKTFSEESLLELSRSIEERGILQPILAEEQEDGSYLIIAGERRYRAAKLAGLTVVPVLTGEFTDEEKLEIALIENIQRENINPIEEAYAFQDLLEAAELTQEELAHRLGKSRPAIANALRLLKLPEAVQQSVADNEISAGHARALLSLDDEEQMNHVFEQVRESGYSVRQTESLCAQMRTSPTRPSGKAPKTGKPAPTVPTKSVEMIDIEQQLIEKFGTKVQLFGTNTHGRIEVSYFSMDDLERILEIIGG